MEETTKKTKKQIRFSLSGKIACLALIPTLVMAAVLATVGISSIREGMQTEVLQGLRGVAISVGAAFDALDPGDYSVQGDELYKGNTDITAGEDLIDSFVEGTSREVTLFYNDTRYATTLISPETGKRIVGTQSDPDVYKRVVKNGETVEVKDLVINEEPFYACYIPMKNSDGSIVGMFFAGQPSASVESYVKARVIRVSIAVIIVSILSVAAIVVVAGQIRKGVKDTEQAVSALAAGNLNVSMDEKSLKRNDELGDMLRGTEHLKNRLSEVIGGIVSSIETLAKSSDELSSVAATTSATADEIAHAVEDISKGAVSQAEEIESASARINNMGDMIGKIVTSVGSLDNISSDMKNNGDDAMVIVKELAASNDATIDAIERIDEKVNATNESASKISEAIQLITSIAEETNLLSLNASIEAARAGEQGRGFAVVASQIQKLAEQSNESANSIAETIKVLLDDAENTVKVMDEVRSIVRQQQEKFNQTRKQFSNVYSGIDKSHDETEGIKDKTGACDNERIGVEDTISSLSTISEENAAATQQTTASMEELNATINLLSGSASDLNALSEELKESIKFFKL